ncbi:kelch-like ECH-associated protein 1B isoform X2 [Amphibalanus amphitrite]|uniref:kelch-like ECH-associated protein 1B isoform X2 n=1 Tax=Amphibalanus amphitrite TaxID=1232801 RepID=UPI001C915771|nr:kelch-like ECH-associated protein 1B isoform X2 [Amphibalanus amphitrite]XP_043244359.1 kelch-like ECH-associated protein 1B isoform X2 [Amphibalanus amphitrite]XP_043244360.1 kelch-like ECH-associated protein 1B isoform X2 [Amphibalanus amphitrite]XP_043244361.1 kelch-like ECH-associated protein 1B isoform X2 [Amphibalanus amphitrite]XP_043244362.1 kelch-like ECH-associated protein 1B isoform X2 [Amphibalanus amphitrite]
MSDRGDGDGQATGSTEAAKPCHGNCFKPKKSVESKCTREMHFKMPKYLTDAFKTMFKMRGDGLLTDVILELESEEVRAHKLVLAAASPYFKAMFTSGLRESSMSSIKLQGVCSYTFSRLLLFAYTGEITVNEQTVCALLPAATMFQMQHVIEVCCNFLKNQLEPSNAIGIATFAEQHGCMELLHTATQFIEQHFTQIAQEEEFLMLNPSQLIKLIHRDELNVFDERDVYKAVLQWVMYDEKARRPKLECIMKSVRCELLPARYLKDELENQPLLRGHDPCREYLVRLLKEMSLHKPTGTKERTPNAPCLIYVAGGYFRYSLDKMECFAPADRHWHELAPLPDARSGLGGAFMGGLLYVVGGRKNNTTGVQDTNRVDVYNPICNTWRTCPGMMVERSRLGVGVLDGYLYAVGGSNGQECLSSIERYCPDREFWAQLRPMATPRTGLGVAVVNRLMYALGGYDGCCRLRSAECYHPEEDSWTPIPPMTTPRSGVGIGVIDRFIYVVGGYDGSQQLRTVERYDTEARTWRMVTPLPSAKSALSVTVDEGKLYAFGGFDGTQFVSTVEMYDPARDAWSACAPMTTARSGHVSAASVRPCFAHTDPSLLDRHRRPDCDQLQQQPQPPR